MKPYTIPSRRWATVALACLFSFFAVMTAADAKEKPKKTRGIISNFNVEARTMTLTGNKGDKNLTWVEGVKLTFYADANTKKPEATIAEVKDGMFALCWLDAQNNVKAMRVYPEAPSAKPAPAPAAPAE